MEKKFSYKKFWEVYNWSKKTHPSRNPLQAAANNQNITIKEAEEILTKAKGYSNNKKNEMIELPKIQKESEKAIMIIAVVGLLTSDFDSQKNVNVWIPKSMIEKNQIPTWLYNKKIDEINNKFDNFSFINFKK